MIQPGTVLLHCLGGIHTVSRRKDDNTGWWLTDGAGIADRVIASGYGTEWIAVEVADLRDLFTWLRERHSQAGVPAADTATQRDEDCGTCANSGWVGSRTDPTDCPTCGRKPYWLVGDGTYPSPVPATDTATRDQTDG